MMMNSSQGESVQSIVDVLRKSPFGKWERTLNEINMGEEKLMSSSELPLKDNWDKIEIVSKLVGSIVIPLVLGLSVYLWNTERINRDTATTMTTIAVAIVNKESNITGDEIDPLRDWAISVLQSPSTPPALSDDAAEALRAGQNIGSVDVTNIRAAHLFNPRYSGLRSNTIHRLARDQVELISARTTDDVIPFAFSNRIYIYNPSGHDDSTVSCVKSIIEANRIDRRKWFEIDNMALSASHRCGIEINFDTTSMYPIFEEYELEEE